jgi:tetratricopeptide (TPR) repeat protein
VRLEDAAYLLLQAVSPSARTTAASLLKQRTRATRTYSLRSAPPIADGFTASARKSQVSLNNVALLYVRQGQYAKAEPFYQRALTIQEKTPGAEHPNIVVFLRNYALCLRAMDRSQEAEHTRQDCPSNGQHSGLYGHGLKIDLEFTQGALAGSIAQQSQPLSTKALDRLRRYLGWRHQRLPTLASWKLPQGYCSLGGSI